MGKKAHPYLEAGISQEFDKKKNGSRKLEGAKRSNKRSGKPKFPDR